MKLFKKKEALETTENITKPKKKLKKRWIVLAVVVLLIAFVVVRNIQASNAPLTVTTVPVMSGDIEEVVSISGNITSDETKTYYSDITAPVDQLELSAGDRVNKGDVLFAYNESDLAEAKTKAELSLQQANGNYSGSIEKNNKATDVLTGLSIHDINTRLDEITAEVDALNDKITEKTSRMNQTLTDLQKTSQDIDQNGVSDSYDATQKNDSPETRHTEDGTQMSLEIQNAIADVQYALSNDPEIQSWNKQITALNEEKQDLTEQAGAEQSKLTSGEKSALDAQRQLTELESTNTIADIENAEGGVKADFAGVVTEVEIEKGATVTAGTKVMTVESTDNVRVDVQISKADLGKVNVGQAVDVTVNGNTYEGEVTKIAGAAKKNASGVPVVDGQIKIKNPDDKIILGVESTNKIHTQKAEHVIVIPYEYVGTDSVGDFVMTVENGVLTRRDVTIGITSTTDAEITEGLSEGENIVAADVTTLVEGTPAVAILGE